PGNCVLTSAEDCAARSGRDAGPGTCTPNPCGATTTTTTPGGGGTTTTTPGGGSTTTTMPGGGGGCCGAAQIVTVSSAGTLTVDGFSPFPFPPNVQTTIEVGDADATCKHTGIVPAGGFTVPAFC